MLSGRCLFIFPFASPMRLQKFSRFCSRPPFRVFTLESFFLSIFIFSSFIFFYCPIMHLTIQNSFRTSERLIKIFCWLRKRDNSLLITKNFEDSWTEQTKEWKAMTRQHPNPLWGPLPFPKQKIWTPRSRMPSPWILKSITVGLDACQIAIFRNNKNESF